MSPQQLDKGGHNVYCPPKHFVIKNNVVVQISTMNQTHLYHVVICHIHRDVLSELSSQDVTKDL